MDPSPNMQISNNNFKILHETTKKETNKVIQEKSSTFEKTKAIVQEKITNGSCTMDDIFKLQVVMNEVQSFVELAIGARIELTDENCKIAKDFLPSGLKASGNVLYGKKIEEKK